MHMSQRLNWLALGGALVPTLLLIALTLQATDGIWEYALDDVYIHLAMSEGVARGEYGVNVGEPASASSSILFSYILAPFAGTSFHVWWPLVVGLLSALWAGWLWGGILRETAPEAPAWFTSLMAIGIPVFLHFPAMALIGMEHMLHIAVTLAALLGLLRFARTGHIGALLVIGLALNPLLRFEGAAVMMLGLCVLAFSGRFLAALGIFVAAAIPLAAHFAYMASLGLDMLPNSVNAKSTVTGGGTFADSDQLSLIGALMESWLFALNTLSGRTLWGAVAAGAVLLIIAHRQLPRVYRLIGWMAVLTMLAHVLFGLTNWFFRYELYAWAFAVGAGAVLMSRTALLARPVYLGLYLLGVAYGGQHYVLSGFIGMPSGSAAVAAQQRQMARFVDDFWQAPVAVNDLGHVAFNNPHYVLDLWGLANAKALRARIKGDDPLWADKLADNYGVGAAMIYDHWLGDSIGPDWVKVAELTVTIPQATLGGTAVSLYATGPGAVAPLTDALNAFGPTLPTSTELKFLEVSQ